MPQILLQLNRIATEEKVSLDSVSPQPPIPYSGYSAVPLSIQLTGDYFNVQSFLQQLLKQVTTSTDGVRATGRLYDVLNVTLSLSSTPPQLTATMTLDAFIVLAGHPDRRADGRDHDDQLGSRLMAGRAEDIEARRVRRQKIFVAVGGVVLLAVVGFEVLPGVLSSSSSGGSEPSPRRRRRRQLRPPRPRWQSPPAPARGSRAASRARRHATCSYRLSAPAP